jgi:hypothetical protein
MVIATVEDDVPAQSRSGAQDSPTVEFCVAYVRRAKRHALPDGFFML